VVLRILSMLLVMALAISLPEAAFAQKANGTSTSSDKPANGTRKQLTMIVFAGISGAILGLSTLSFYGRPQDKLNNIWGGFAVGIIVGAIYSAYSVTSQPRQFSRGAQIWDDEQWLRDHPRFAANNDPVTFSYAFHF
jgi:hypothetical protein